MGRARIIGWMLGSAWLCSFNLAGLAQQNPRVSPEALMQLMLSQPSVDVNSPVGAQAVLDPPVVAVGQKAVYRISLNALEASVRFTQQIGVPPGLKITPAAQGQVMQAGMGSLRPLTALNFHVVAERPGFYTIPGFVLEVYGKPVAVPETMLEVADKLEPGAERARELIIEPARTNVYLGENVRVRVYAPTKMINVIDTLTELQFNGDGFLDDKMIFRQQNAQVDVGGRDTQAWMVESSVTPVAAGPQTLAAQAFTAGMHIVGPASVAGQALTFASAMRYVLLNSDPIALNVRPLPPEETTSGFTGFIGKVTVERPLVSTNSLRVGDALRLLVTFRGDHRMMRLDPPDVPRVSGWQVFAASPAEPPPVLGPVTNLRVAFAYTLIPMSEEVRQTPAIPFSVFDPDRGAYDDLTIPPLNVQVSAEGLPADWKPASWAGSGASEKKATLSVLATASGKTVGSFVPVQLRGWFWPAQLAPALLLLGLWRWDQRRRFLEAHPEIVRRRQARRALRREKRALREAAASGDAPGFVRRAVNALQIAAAPHFPAEPRALVCHEVLSLFDEPDRAGNTGNVIRSLFTSEERSNFSTKRDGETPLFALHPELEGILKRMEARL